MRSLCPRAGDALLLPEATTHAVLPWRPRDRPRRTLHVGYHNREAYGQGSETMPADAAESAKQAARAFVAGVPSEYEWMYQAEQLVREQLSAEAAPAASQQPFH